MTSIEKQRSAFQRDEKKVDTGGKHIRFEGKLRQKVCERGAFAIVKMEIVSIGNVDDSIKEDIKKLSTISCKGLLAAITPGAIYVITGTVSYNTKFRQYDVVVSDVVESVSMTLNGLMDMIATEVTGIGPRKARSIVDHYGDPEKCINALVNKDRAIHTIAGDGIDLEALSAWASSHQRTGAARQYLSALGITPYLSAKIIEKFGSTDLEKTLRARCFELTTVPQIGFLTASRVADALGVPPNATHRIKSAVQYVLGQVCSKSGGMCYTRDELLAECQKILTASEHEITHCIQQMYNDGDIVSEDSAYDVDCPDLDDTNE